MKKVINKGYTITVVSWENDGDNYRTEEKTVETKEEAAKINFICKKLFVCCHDNESGIGNSMDRESDDIIKNFIKNNPQLNLTVDYINDLAIRLMGGSEYYDYRICECCTTVYSSEDIYLEEINF